MSRRKPNRHGRTPQEPATVLCSCKCPFWGKPHDHIYEVRCRCGREAAACGHCLEAGRVTRCLECHRADLRTGAGDN